MSEAGSFEEFRGRKRENGGRSAGRSGGRSGGRFGGRSDRGDSGGSRFGRGSDRSDRGSSDRGFGRRERPQMTQVTCDQCGVKCEVPFKPSSDKPVYCSDCFEAKGEGRSSNRGRPNHERVERGPDKLQEKFDEINAKLDKIIDSLGLD